MRRATASEAAEIAGLEADGLPVDRWRPAGRKAPAMRAADAQMDRIHRAIDAHRMALQLEQSRVTLERQRAK